MKLDIMDRKGQQTTQAELPDDIFAVPVKNHLIHDVVRYQMAKQRRGTSATKNRSAVSGGGIKPWRQKGTGRARAGTIRSPLWVGGGIVFGPQPRDYSFKVNKKVRKGALKSALSYKAQNQDVVMVEDFDLEEGKTRLAAEFLHDCGFEKDSKVLILVDGGHENLRRASRNIPGVMVLDVQGLNVYDILWHHKLLIMEHALTRLQEVLGS